MSQYLKNLKSDFPSAVVVFLIAVPLCLGIAVGSGVNPIAGIIAGVAGGIVVGSISNSQLSVSGPAAGLISTVALILEKVPVFEALLLSIVLAGLFQIGFGLMRSGVLVNFVPVSVLKGMMAAIGLLLILKQFPHLIGYDADFEGDESFIQSDGQNTFTEILTALGHFTPLAVMIGLLGLAIQIFWDSRFFPFPKYKLLFPAPLVVVLAAVFINMGIGSFAPEWAIRSEHMVNLPVLAGIHEIGSLIRLPDFKYLGQGIIWLSAIQIAIIASIESLLCIEATDKLDEQKRITGTNRELIAQGAGNIVSGMLGGLPVTSVIVRSSVNINSGAKTKMSTILHGTILLISVLAFPGVLNYIPLSALAAILLYTGYKLAKPMIFREMYAKGMSVFVPFIATITAILLTDLLVGIVIGILVGVYFIMRSNFKESIKIQQTDQTYLFKFGSQVSFLNKALLKEKLAEVEDGATVYFDLSKCNFLDYDIIDILDDFNVHAKADGIRVDYKFASPVQKKRFKSYDDDSDVQKAAKNQATAAGRAH